MNNSKISRGSFLTKAFLSVAGSLVLGHFSVSNASDLLSAGVDLGLAGPGPQWGMFLLGNGDINEINGSSLAFGHIGAGGFDEIKIRNNATVEGDVILRDPTLLSLAKNAHILGNVISDPVSTDRLQQGVEDARKAARAAFNLQRTVGFPKTISTNQNRTITGSGTVVLKLDDLRLMGNAALTLQGDSSTTFIIDVHDQFFMGGNSRIVLSGGLEWNDVLINIGGVGEATLSKNAQLDAILLATKRTVELSGSAQVRGEIIAGAVKMSGSSVVGRIPVVSP